MNKIWFVLIENKREGPYSYTELKYDDRLTPDTLVWKEGFLNWRKIRDVPELKELFKDSPESIQPEENGRHVFRKKTPQDELVMDFRNEPPFLLWVLFALIAFFYVVIRLYTKS